MLHSSWRRVRRLTAGLLAAYGLLMAVLIFTPLANYLARPLAVEARLQAADAIVVLGGGVHRDGALSDSSLRRLIHGLKLHRQGYAPIVILVSADPLRPAGLSEARAMWEEATRLGVPSDVFLLEEASRRTREHAAEVAEIARARGVRAVLLVTDPTHMLRAGLAFERAGLIVRPAPTDDRELDSRGLGRLGLAYRVTYEYAALLSYRLRGWL